MTVGNANHQREPWHISRTVSISHILTTVAMVGTVLFYVQKMDTRISLAEQRLEMMEMQRRESDLVTAKSLDDIKELLNNRFDEIGRRMDRIEDRAD